jgi:glycosyltransferase involved in cell wall biosynthesis
MKNTFYVSCPVDTYSGYGARARDFVKALIELNEYDVKIISQRWGTTPFGFIDDHENEWGFLKKHLVGNQLTEQPDIWMQITVPNEFQPVGKYNIGLTAGIETTACAPQWIQGCNRMDLVLTSSNHSKKVFEQTSYKAKDEKTGNEFDLKLEKPIKVLIEGANLDVYKPLKKSSEFDNRDLYNDIKEIKEDFAYLFVGHWMQGELGEDRKNVGLLIKAFYEIFKNRNKVPALILKTSQAGASYMDRREIQKRIDALRKTVPARKLPSVYLLHGEFTDEEMNELYNNPKVKAMVSLTKGEGFGRPLLEFSLCNKPITTTGWSGHVDFLDKEFTGLMGGKLTPIHPSAQVKDMLIEGSQWFSVDQGHIGYYLNEIFENYKEWKNKSNRQGFKSRKEFSFEIMQNQIKDILKEHLPNLPKKVEIKIPDIKKINLPKKPKKLVENG